MTNEEIASIEAELPKRDFAIKASPAFWKDYGEELYESARTLIAAGRDELIVRGGSLIPTSVQSPHSRAYCLLAAFSLENLLKGIAVARTPTLVANGELAATLQSHGLLHLASDVAHIRLAAAHRRTCGILESAIPSWGRYPVATKAKTVVREKGASSAFEVEVDALYRVLAELLERELKRPWKGPHGATVISDTIPVR